jgi:polysaccharide biosynthesis protein PslG
MVPIVLLALAGVALAAVLASYLAALLRPLPVETARRAIAFTDVNPYGANFFLHEEVEEWKRERTVRMAQGAGIGWAKQQFLWSDIEPNEKGVYRSAGSQSDSWSKYDQIVDLFGRYGIRVIARLDRAPDWARPADSRKEHPPADFDDFGDFVYAFVDHYRGKIHYIQIWNEPNIYPEWGEQPVDPAAYVELLKVAYLRAKEADPNVQVLSAPLAITLEQLPGRRNLSDLVFLKEMYEAGAGDYFDILSANAFGMDLPPSAPANPDVLNFSRVLLQRDIMARYDDTHKPVWFNEYGWNAAPPSFPKEQLIWERVSEAQQAKYTVDGIALARSEWPWAGVFNIWYFRQVGHIQPSEPAYYFRMVDVDFTPRPIYYAVQEHAESLKVAAPGVIEESNPAVTQNVGWLPAGDERASGQRYVVNVEPSASMTVRFRGNSIALLTRTGPDGGRLLARLDGSTINQLPSNENGESFIDLRSDEEQWGARLPIAVGLSFAEHTLELSAVSSFTGANDSLTCIVDGFEILAARRPVFPVIPVAALGALVLGLSGFLLVERSRRRRPV